MKSFPPGGVKADNGATQQRRPTVIEPLIHTVKEMAAALSRSEDYVNDMKRGGFRLPATRGEAIAFIHCYGKPGQFRRPQKNRR